MAASAAFLDRRIPALIAKIDEGNCVLVLGPRIAAPRDVTGVDVPIDTYLAARLYEDLNEPIHDAVEMRRAIARYQRERSAAACRSLIQELTSEFDGHTTELHLDLATLPFRLILSATPDRMMAEAIRKTGRHAVREACYDYCGSGNSDISLRLPTVNEPVVYSLFGRHDRPESMVLDEKNLLDYLIAVTRESPALPDEVRATLRDPKTVFLFVGFGFSNWWLRLLLKVLDVTGVENRGLSLALEDESTFEAATKFEQKGFFEPLGIYIQARDWNVLARELAARVRQIRQSKIDQAETGAANRVGLSERIDIAEGGKSARNDRRPLVFLSYASDDLEQVSILRELLQSNGIAVWHDKQNLRAGQNWDDQIARVIRGADFFVFLQSEKMDERDRLRQSGVYNRELKRAFERQENLPGGVTYLFHATIGTCRERPEAELGQLQRISIDSKTGQIELARCILDSFHDGTFDHRIQA